ncbi:MAG: FecR domain-containing protein [Gammaproteobacteria bacterium]
MNRCALVPLARLAAVGLLWMTVTMVSASDWLYTVRDGDNLWNLTEEYLTTLAYVPRLQNLNHVADPYHIPPGTKLRMPLAWLKQNPVSVRVAEVNGIKLSAKKGGTEVAATAGLELVSGDSLTSGPGTSALLEFKDGSQLLVQADTEIVFDTLQAYGTTGMVDTRVHVVHGRVESKVRAALGEGSRFDIATPAAVTAVRGTQYRVGAEAHRSQAEVLQGKVEVSGERRTVGLNPGYGTVTNKGEPPMPPVQLLPPPNLDQVPEVFSQVPIVFSVPALSGAERLRLQIFADASFHTLLFDDMKAGLQVHGPTLADGQYRLRLRAVDGLGIEGRDAERSFSINAMPEPPALLAPGAGDVILDDKPQFEWALPEGVGGFHLQLARDEKFSPPLMADQRIQAAGKFTVNQTLPTGQYYWRVAAVDAQGDGPFSDTQTFRRSTPGPSEVTRDIDKEEMVLRWRAGSAAQRFKIQMAKNNDFVAPVVDTGVNEAQLKIKRPESGKYFVRIRAIDADGYEGPWGTTQSVDVPSTRSYWWMLAIPLIPVLL